MFQVSTAAYPIVAYWFITCWKEALGLRNETEVLRALYDADINYFNNLSTFIALDSQIHHWQWLLNALDFRGGKRAESYAWQHSIPGESIVLYVIGIAVVENAHLYYGYYRHYLEYIFEILDQV